MHTSSNKFIILYSSYGMFEAEIIFADKIDAIYKALKPDIEDDKNVMISINDHLVISISTEKISDLRANINSYLRLLKSCIECLE